MYIPKWEKKKKKHSEKAICYMSPTIWHSGKSKIIGTVLKNQWFPGFRGKGEGWIDGAQGIFMAV